jgi:hypothetical protein
MLFLRYYLWIAPNVLLGIVLVRFLRLRLQRRLPFFFTYIVFQLVEFVIMFTINFSPSFSLLQFQWAVVIGLGISALLKLAIVYEVANDLLVSRSVLAPFLKRLLRWIGAFLLLVSAVGSAVLTQSSLERVENVFHVVDLSSNVVLVGLLLVLFLFRKVFLITWRGCTAGIALGFGVFASVELATAALRVEYGRTGQIIIDLISMAAYQVCVLVWLVYFFLPERFPTSTGTGLQTSELESWDQELERLAQR